VINLAHPPDVVDLAAKTRDFIRVEVLPVEDEHAGNMASAGGDELRTRLQHLAWRAGVFAPHAPTKYGGLGLNMADRAPVFEEAGYSLFGPVALNVAAPDEGNVHMLEHIATAEQKEQFLAPLAAGEVRSAFAMTEPAPGAGSDPTALVTRAEKVPGGWRINGHKYFITGADGAGFFIIFARTSGNPGDRSGGTMFITPADAPGLKVGRHIETLDKSMIGGHCEVHLDDLFVPDGGVLGEVDDGFSAVQVRLGPARMTHVMRWLGAARRARDIAVAHVCERRAFGGRLSDLGMIHQMVADSEIDIAATRSLLLQACWELDQGRHASNATSVAKTFAAEAIFRVVDRSVQMCGGLGVSGDLPLARLAGEVRGFRIYDGASEVHRWAIAKRTLAAYSRAGRKAMA
jgi:acyl-CoA dehydrogenase